MTDDIDYERRLEVIVRETNMSDGRLAAARIAVEHYRGMSLPERLALLQEKWDALTQTWEFNEFSGMLAIHKISQLPADQEVVYGTVQEPHTIKVSIGFTPEVLEAMLAEEATGA